jgi:hypothetical protein
MKSSGWKGVVALIGGGVCWFPVSGMALLRALISVQQRGHVIGNRPFERFLG